MIKQNLLVKFSRTYDEKPLAIIRNLPGQDAEFRPFELRALASALMQAATDIELLEVASKDFQPEEKTYGLDSLSAAERRVNMRPDGSHEIEIEQYIHNGHKIKIYQDAQLTNGRPTFFVIVGQALVQAPDAFSIQEAREIGNQKASRRKPGKYAIESGALPLLG